MPRDQVKASSLSICILAMTMFASPCHAGNATIDFGLLNEISPLGSASEVPDVPADGVLLLQFWASWCHSCGSLMWDMDEIVSANDSVSYLAVSLDDESEAASQYIRKHKLYGKYKDRYFIDLDKALSASLDIQTVPSILVVSPGGAVLVHKSGHLNSTDLHDIANAIRQTP